MPALFFAVFLVTTVLARRLKPENILLDEDDRIMLIDFGIAKESADLAVTHTLARSVSYGFSPPEQVLGTGTDQRSDVYALGATMYALLTGTVPPGAHERVAGKELPAPRALNPAIPQGLDAVILQTLDLNLNRRPQTIAELSRVFTPGTLDAPLPDTGLGTRTVRVRAERPLRAPARIPIRTGRVTDAPPGIEPRRGRRALWIIAGGFVVASAVAAWRLLEPRSPATAHIETPAAPVVAAPAVPVTIPADSPAPPPPAPVQPEPPRPQELGPASRFLEGGLSKQTTPTVVTPTRPPIPTTSPGTRPMAPDPVGKVAPPLDPVGTKEVPNQKRPPVALAPSPPRSPSTPSAKTRPARDPVKEAISHLNYVSALVFMRREKEAVDHAEAFLSSHPDSALMSFGLAEALERRKDYPRAHELASRSIALFESGANPSELRYAAREGSARVYGLHARLAARVGREDEAWRSIDKAASLRNDLNTRYSRASVHYIEGNWEKSLQGLHDAYAQAKGDEKDSMVGVESRFLLGQCYQQLGKWREAREAYEKFIAANTFEKEAFANLGLVKANSETPKVPWRISLKRSIWTPSSWMRGETAARNTCARSATRARSRTSPPCSPRMGTIWVRCTNGPTRTARAGSGSWAPKISGRFFASIRKTVMQRRCYRNALSIRKARELG